MDVHNDQYLEGFTSLIKCYYTRVHVRELWQNGQKHTCTIDSPYATALQFTYQATYVDCFCLTHSVCVCGGGGGGVYSLT